MLYVHASRQQHPGRSIELQAHNLSTGETYPITLTEKKEQSLYNELEQAILGRERHEFPPKPDVIRCPGCPSYLFCTAEIRVLVFILFMLQLLPVSTGSNCI